MHLCIFLRKINILVFCKIPSICSTILLYLKYLALNYMCISGFRKSVWTYFAKKCIANLRIALVMSPDDALRTRCRNYPGLINNTTIDWMFTWPQQALIAVANVLIRTVRNKETT